MYRDLPNLKIIAMNDFEIQAFMTISPNNNYIIAGHAPFWKIFGSPENKFHIDEIFYKLAEVPFENKWNEFFVQRDLDREKEVFKKLGLKEGEKYIFVHDDPRRKITQINSSLLRVIKPTNKEFSLFDFLYTIENAKEIHCINSSFFCLIDCIGIKKETMVLHQYARKDIGKLESGVSRKEWKILE